MDLAAAHEAWTQTQMKVIKNGLPPPSSLPWRAFIKLQRNVFIINQLLNDIFLAKGNKQKEI